MSALWLLVLVALWLAAHLLLRKGTTESGPAVVAHRGAAAVAPENTLAAIQAGVRSGAQFLEVDVQLSADEALVLLHDRTVDRTTDGEGRVDDLSLEELQQLDAGSWYSSEFSGEPVPTLDEAVAELEGWKGTFVVEAKHPRAHPGLALALATFVEKHPEIRFDIVSFDHEWLKIFGSLLPAARVGELSVVPLGLPDSDRVARIGVIWLAPVLDPTLVRRAHARDLQVWVWTVDRPWQIRLMSWLGVDAVTTNEPAAARRVIGG